ncbi:prostaglandin E synthase 2 [Anopheles marshallii]|uniref:prostaglandin E synthase 2 n=1 Tax=Anopheles marshallii TaxID=1521116 RepID=UPI00237C4045|nr:prostaglandin E synthase 2 [Anopheles marshallii]
MATFRLGAIASIATRLPHQNVAKLQRINLVRRFATGAAPKKPTSTLGLALKGMAVGALVGTGWSGYNFFKGGPTDHMLHEHVGPKVLDKLPDVKIMRKVVNPKDDSELDLVLFQFQTCPFCCKNDLGGILWMQQRALLQPQVLCPKCAGDMRLKRYKGIDGYSFLRDKKQDIGELAKYYPSISYENDAGRKVFDIMNKYFLMFQEKKVDNRSKEEQEEERKWRAWADDHLVHLISPNVYRTKDEALETFEWFSDVGEWNVHFPKWERDLMVYVGAFAMWGISKRLKKRHQLSDDVRSHIYDACDRWIGEIEKKKTVFHGGSQPNLADLAVFGVLNSMEGCQAFKDCLENSKIGPWFYAVKERVLKNRGNAMYK